MVVAYLFNRTVGSYLDKKFVPTFRIDLPAYCCNISNHGAHNGFGPPCNLKLQVYSEATISN